MVLGLKKKKGSPVSVVYEIRLNEVKPWPCIKSPAQLVIQWQRGEKRSGSTRIMSCDRDRICINESFSIPATLYKLPSDNRNSAAPKFHKKCVIFTLCDAQHRLHPLGRAVLDLADYASVDTSSNSSIVVAVAKRELSALGTPYLSFTISPQSPDAKPQQQQAHEDHASLVSDEEGKEAIAYFTDDDDDKDEALLLSSAPSYCKQEQPVSSLPAASTSSTTVQANESILDAAASNPKSVATLAAASVYASKRKPSFNAAVLSNMNVLQAARTKYAEGAAERGERLDKKAVEEARQRAAAAEAKAAAAVEKANQLEMEIKNLKWELQEAAALEHALYSVVAQHGSSSHKIHAPARRLARIYRYTCNNNSSDGQARASTARACASGLIVAVRACENDVSRLTFWWSNVVVLREMISQAVKIPPAQSNEVNVLDWRKTSTLYSTLERIEAWIFGRIVECIWWQSLTPHMQSSVATDQNLVPSTPSSSSDKSVISRLKKSVRGLVISDFAGSEQGNLSMEIWKSAFLDALQRICPVRAGGHECGCLQVVTRMVVEQCVARLDVAMFNAILRDMEENVPTDPISDPISELSVLPIAPDNITFGGGAQLKNVINTWSTWLLTLTADGDEEAAAEENMEKGKSHFTLLRAMSDLLMLPKDMLMDKTVRKEVCPALSLLLIRRVLSKFNPDEFSPEPVPPSLLAALNGEISMERQRVGEEDVSPTTVIMASAPPVVYFPPIRETYISSPRLSRNSSLFRKGNTSDDELEELESPLSLLVDNGCLDSKTEVPHLQTSLAKRYRLLRQIWNVAN